MHFLYPADVLKPKQPDEMYGSEVAAMRAAGLAFSVVTVESLVSGPATIHPAIPPDQTVVYRGWMLSGTEYQALAALVESRGAAQLTSPESYLLTHHLPNWYPLLEEFTPETEVVSVDADLEQVLRNLAWGKYFIKDYVKSLKTSVGSIVERPAQARAVVSEMQKYRGKIEGGLCIRRVEEFLPETERRFFVINGQPHAPAPEEDIPVAVQVCSKRIQSPFFSVDVVRRADGIERIVEIGDGQVSDIVGWEAQRFAHLWG